MEYNVWPTVPTLIPSLTGGGGSGIAGMHHHTGTSRSVSPPPPSNNVFTLRGNQQGYYSVRAVSFGDGRLASTGDSTVVVWSLTEWRPMRTLSGPRKGTKYDFLCWDPKNPSTRLVSASAADRTLKLWDLKAKSDTLTEFQTNGDVLTHVVWSPDGNSIILGNAANLSVFDVRQNRIITSRKFEYFINQFTYVGENKLAVGTQRGHVEFLDPSSLATKQTLAAHPAELHCIATNPRDFHQFATGGHDAIVEMWTDNKIDFTCSSTVDRHISKIESLSFSGNGRWLASSSSGEKMIDISSVESGELITSITQDDVISMLSFDRNKDSETSLLAFCTENSKDVYIQSISGEGNVDRPLSRG